MTAGALFDRVTAWPNLLLAARRADTQEAGGSEFIRGSCWVGPLGPIQSERGRR